MMYQTISPAELFSRLETGENLRFIDVREPIEHEMVNIEAAELLPLSSFNDWIDTLKKDEEIVVMCHHGIRSANVCMFLVRNGFEKVYNLDGGIDLWANRVDLNMPKY
jgi:rhodanese-related sulfurtransferase